MRLDPSKVIQGNPCGKGHSGLRYRSTGHCAECSRASNFAPQARAARRASYVKAKAVRSAMRAARSGEAEGFPASRELIPSHRRNGRRVFTIAERTMTLAGWCAELRQDFDEVRRRLYAGWSIFDALNQPTARRIETP